MIEQVVRKTFVCVRELGGREAISRKKIAQLQELTEHDRSKKVRLVEECPALMCVSHVE